MPHLNESYLTDHEHIWDENTPGKPCYKCGLCKDEWTCHCGKPVHIHTDLGGFTRGLCLECDTVRCDANPGECK